jgi:hypothetical protein
VRRIYEAILRLYPAEYKAAFASEMISVFEQAAADHKKAGTLTFSWFSACELAGLLKGLLAQHLAKLAARDSYITERCALQQNTGLRDDIAEAQRHLEHLLSSMEFAIAHHDFPKARYYSDEERIARTRLEQLMSGSHGCV